VRQSVKYHIRSYIFVSGAYGSTLLLLLAIKKCVVVRLLFDASSFENTDFWFAFVHKIAVLVLTRRVSQRLVL
jgi:hypothetical protein